MLIAVWSSIAYAVLEMLAAHRCASAMELPGMPTAARWGQIEKSTNRYVVSSPVGVVATG
jgi:hypothetical protein